MRSMTAFAREAWRGESGELVWEVRSVNHRYLEAHFRLPEDFRALEPALRSRISERLGRGKVECGLRYKGADQAVAGLQINQPMAGHVLEIVREMQSMMHGASSPGVMDVLRWPGVTESIEVDISPIHKHALELFDQTLTNLVETREREGAKLVEVIVQRCDGMSAQVEIARARLPQVLALQKQKIRDRLAEVMEQLDQDRIEQEMALLAQRLDIDEELDRLVTHLDEVRRIVTLEEPIGRRLDFMMQELNREANTLGSKSADSETTAVSVEMKVLIEQMREQVQNIE
ncbi:MAG: YicC/YloC family endoribonuclease [bacterium]